MSQYLTEEKLQVHVTMERQPFINGMIIIVVIIIIISRYGGTKSGDFTVMRLN